MFHSQSEKNRRDHSANVSKSVAHSMLENEQHGAAKSISMDDEELDETTSMEAESFLESYEEMLRYQKDEMDVTLRHLEPLLEILESKSDVSTAVHNQSTRFTREFTYNSLKQALVELEEDASLRFITSDLQWKLVLELLTENQDSCEDRISWAEIVMCYRTCIIGMQALDQTPTPEHNQLRARIRQRSMHMLSTFRCVGRNFQSTDTNSKSSRSKVGRGRFEWLDSIFIYSALLMLGAIVMSALDRRSGFSIINHKARVEGIFQALPLIPGPHVAPFSTETMIIRGPHALPYAEALLIPGPTAPPFYVSDDATASPFPVEDDHRVSSPPTSVAETSDRLPQKSTRMGGPLQSQRSMMRQRERNVEKNDMAPPDALHKAPNALNGKESLKRRALAVALIAGGTAAAGAVVPMVASLATTITVSGLVPTGATVVVSTLLAQGIRDWFGSLFSTLRKARQSS